jgi:hypothetical protein
LQLNQNQNIMKTLYSFLAVIFITCNAFCQTYEQVTDNTLGNNYSQNSGGSGGGSAIISSETFSRAAIFCDDFNRINSTTVAGWTEQTGDWQITNNMLQNPNYPEWMYITADGTSQADGCITLRAIYGTPVQLKFVGAVARYNGHNSNILFKIQDNQSTGYWDSFWVYTNGNSLNFYSTFHNFGTDAIIQLEYTGSNVTIRIDIDRDGIWDYTNSGTVGNTSAGLCGVGAYDNAFTDDFCCGNDCNLASVPLSNFGLYIALGLIVVFVAFRMYRKA